MTDDPAIRARGQDVELVLFDASATVVKGVVALAETSAGEAGAPFGEFGPLCWIAYDADPKQIEFVQYRDPATRRRTHRRVIKGERIGAQWNTCKLHLASRGGRPRDARGLGRERLRSPPTSKRR